MESPNRTEIQGMLRYGYGRLKHAYYLFLRITAPEPFRHWLNKTPFQNAASSPREQCFNLAFTARGLQQMGYTQLAQMGFTRAFVEGMDTDHRNRILGDFDQNTPTQWEWGSRSDTGLHLMLMIFARTKTELDTLYQQQSAQFAHSGLQELNKIHGQYIQNDQGHYLEHFGFRDGLSQPEMRGTGRSASPDHLLNPGEFILGYPNGYDKIPHNPFAQQGAVDIGKDGTYLVFRQLAQNVPAFWQYIHQQFSGGDPDYQQTIELATKMVGRMPDGTPLVSPEPGAKSQVNDFRFFEQDAKGMQCPIGSHIRRANPRDSKTKRPKANSLDTAVKVANRHRILRRGRPYGEPVVPGMITEEIIRACLEGEIQGERGLNFICFNTDIERQFEFVQHTWANNPKFGRLYNDVDPLIGVKGKNGKMEATQFEVPQHPVRRRYQNIPPFTQVKGGEYFFLPSISTIRFFAEHVPV